jgi:hypothetical protein
LDLDNDLEQFLHKIVPWDASVLLLQQGIVAPIQKPSSDGQSSFPVGIGFTHLEKIYDNIRDTAVAGLRDSLAKEQMEAFALGLPDVIYHKRSDALKLGKLDPEKFSLRKKFEGMVTHFEDNLHMHGISCLALSAYWDGDFAMVRKIIESAISRITAETKRPKEQREPEIEKLKMLLLDFEAISAGKPSIFK